MTPCRSTGRHELPNVVVAEKVGLNRRRGLEPPSTNMCARMACREVEIAGGMRVIWVRSEPKLVP